MLEQLEADLAELEVLQSSATRPHPRAFLAAYAAQLKTELEELKSKAITMATPPAAPPAPQPAVAAAPPKPAPMSIGTSGVPASTPAPMSIDTSGAPVSKVPAPPQPVQQPVRMPSAAASSERAVTYLPIASHSWDQDGYGVEPNNVYVYILSGFDGIGQQKGSVTCDFSKNGFDLKVEGFNGKSYRLMKDNLDKPIVPTESKLLVKKNSIKLSLRKEKETYGYPSWTDLTAKRAKTAEKSDDPGAGLMDMMKQLYEDGDDQMKKTIGEAMIKSRQEQNDPSAAGL